MSAVVEQMDPNILDTAIGNARRPSQSLAANIDVVRRILGDYDVHEPRVFGSVARNTDGFASDLDLIVNVGPGVSDFGLADLWIRLEAVLGCSVDVLTEPGLGGSALRRALSDAIPL